MQKTELKQTYRPRGIKIFPYALIILAPILAFFQLSFCRNCLKWDNLDQFFQNRFYISECLQNGIFPFWNPHIQLGFPMTADPQSAVFYPPTWFWSLLTGYDLCVFNWDWISHIILLGAGVYFFMRTLGFQKDVSCILAILFQLSGPVLSSGQFFSWIIGIAWLPWILAFFIRTLNKPGWISPIMGGVAVFAALTGGYPAFVFVLIYVLGIWTLIHVSSNWVKWSIDEKKHLLFRLGGFGIIAIILTSPYLYSVVKSMPFVNRGSGITVDRALEGSFEPLGFLTMVLPGLNIDFEVFGSMNSQMNIYLGFLCLPFILFGFFQKSLRKRTSKWLIPALILFGISLGQDLPLRKWLYHLPLLDMFRFPSIFRVFALVFLLPCLGYAIEGIRTYGFQAFIDKGLKPFLFIFILLGILVLGKTAAAPNEYTFTTDIFRDLDLFQSGWNIAAIQWLWILILLITVFLIPRIIKKHRLYLLFALLLLDSLFVAQFNSRYNLSSGISLPKLQTELNKYPKGFPIPDINKSMSEQNMYSLPELAPIVYNSSYFEKEFAYDGFYPFSLGVLKQFDEHEDKWERLEEGIIFLESSDGNRIPEATIEVESFQPHHWKLNVTTDENANLVLFQNFYPGWVAYMEGKEVSMRTKYGNIMEVNVPKGSFQVEFVFRDFVGGLLLKLNLLALFAIFIYLVLLGYTRRFWK